MAGSLVEELSLRSADLARKLELCRVARDRVINVDVNMYLVWNQNAATLKLIADENNLKLQKAREDAGDILVRRL